MLVVVILNHRRSGSDLSVPTDFENTTAAALLRPQLSSELGCPSSLQWFPSPLLITFNSQWETPKCCSQGQTFKCSAWTSPRVSGLCPAQVSAPLVEAGWGGKAVLSFSLHCESLGTISVPEPHLKWKWRKMTQIFKKSRQVSQPVLEKGSTVWTVTCCCCWLKTGFVWLNAV